MKIILSLDSGTQSTRAMLFDEKGNLLDKVKETFEPYFSLQKGYAEQHAELYWAKICSAVQTLKSRNSEIWDSVIGVTVTAMRDVGICVDKDMKPLRPALLWLDRREAEFDFDKLPLKSRFCFSLAGMRDAVEKHAGECRCVWIQQNEPEIWKKTDKYFQCSTWLNYKLTGVVADSVASMIGHIPFNYKKKRWMSRRNIQRPVFGDFGDTRLFPIAEPGTVLGRVSEEASAQTGIPAGLPVVASGSDKGCETVGTGAIYPDVASISFGTTATVQLTTDKYVEPEKYLPAYPAVYPNKYNPETIVYRGYWMLTWFLNEFARRQGEELTEKDFDRMLPTVPAGSDGLTVEPYWSPSLKRTEALGAIVGFRERHTVFHIYRAIIEGINFALMEGLKTMEKRAKVNVKRITVSGGGAQSDEVCKITADMFGVPVVRVQTYETSGLGAAICAFVGLKVYPDYDSAISAMVRTARVFEPDPETHYKYETIFKKVYCPVYSRLKPVYKRIKKLKKGEIYV